MQNILKDTKNTKEDNLAYWNAFYRKAKVQKESSFCQLVKNMISKNSIIFDIGCGNGRDSFSFARSGYEVFGIDRSVEAIRFNNTLMENFDYQQLNVKFQTVDVGQQKELSEAIDYVSNKARSKGKILVIYLRFFLHSIDQETEETLLTTVSKYLQSGDIFAAEFRTIEDEEREKVYADHFRRYIVAEELLRDLEEKYQLTKILFEKGTGLAKYKNEDPYVARIIMKK